MRNYSLDLTLSEIQLITYECSLSDTKTIELEIDKEEILSIFMQYIEYLSANLSFNKVIESYAFEQHSISQENFS